MSFKCRNILNGSIVLNLTNFKRHFPNDKTVQYRHFHRHVQVRSCQGRLTMCSIKRALLFEGTKRLLKISLILNFARNHRLSDWKKWIFAEKYKLEFLKLDEFITM